MDTDTVKVIPNIYTLVIGAGYFFIYFLFIYLFFFFDFLLIFFWGEGVL